jgi:tetratricopeptide (TPR) repeat protein
VKLGGKALENPKTPLVYALASAYTSHKCVLQFGTEGVQKFPESADFHFLLYMLSKEQGDTKIAEDSYEKFYFSKPTSEQFHLAYCAFSHHFKREENLEFLKKHLERSAEARFDPFVYESLFQEYAKNNEFEAALEYAIKAVNLKPGDEWRYTNIITCYRKLGNNDEALVWAKKQAEADSSSLTAYNDIKHLCIELKKFKEGLEWLEKFLESDPRSILHIMSLAVDLCLADNLNRGKAIEWLKKGFEFDPANSEICERIAVLYEDQLDKVNAAEWWTKVLELNPTRELYVKVVGLYIDLKKKDQAIPILKDCIRTFPKEPFGYIKLGDILTQLGNFEEALKYFKMTDDAYAKKRVPSLSKLIDLKNLTA